MYAKLLQLEIKQFFRNPQFGTNLAMKILMGFLMVYFALMYLGLPFLLYYLAKDELQVDPLLLFCQFFFYYWVLDLVLRYFMQQMPTQNIKPLLPLNLSKKTLVNYTIVKTFTHFFNWGYLLFLIPFAILLLKDGTYSVVGIVAFSIGILFLFYFSNFLNILLNGRTPVLVVVTVITLVLGGLNYLGYLPITEYSEQVFYGMYERPYLAVVPIVLTIVAAYFAHKTIERNFYLDRGLEVKAVEARTEDISYLNRFGVTGTFIKNDLRLIRRSKAARSAAFMGVLFLFYGFLFFNSAYETDFMKLFAAIFVSGGFMFTYGQMVPSWDSSYYPLMMSLNVPYKQYLIGKWALLVSGTFVLLLLSTFYLFFGLDLWLTILAAGLYNLGVNCQITLLAGAFQKRPIDLNSSTKSMGGKNTFNVRTILLMIPQLVLPMAVYALTKHFFGIWAAVAALGLLGLIGLLLRDQFFNLIVKAYKKEKYSTLIAFKKS